MQGLLCLAVASLSALCSVPATATGAGCHPLPIDHFRWLNPDGSLVNPLNANEVGAAAGDDCCGPACSDTWRPLPQSPSCQFCARDAALVCQGSDVYNVPSPATLPATRLSLFKLSGVGLISIPPKSFMGLDIQKLVIEKTNISSFSLNTFTGVKSIVNLHLRNNKNIYNISQADLLFKNVSGLRILSLEDGSLRILQSTQSAHLYNLTYFSLSGNNNLQSVDLSFLQNSGLQFLDLRRLKINGDDVKGVGFNKLPRSLNTIDLNGTFLETIAIEQIMEQIEGKNITTLNLSNLKSKSKFCTFLPLKPVKDILKYLSLKGNDLQPLFNSSYSNNTVEIIYFVELRELNLENCNISDIRPAEIFKAFPKLTILSLAKNQMLTLDLTWFLFSSSLILIDLSDNFIESVISTSFEVQNQTIQAVDLSSAIVSLKKYELDLFFGFFRNTSFLSLCKIGFHALDIQDITSEQVFSKLRYIDLTDMKNNDFALNKTLFKILLSNNNMTLTELRYAQNQLDSVPSFISSLASLKTLDISSNSIPTLSVELFPPTLKALNASKNLITTWYTPILRKESLIDFLDVSNNLITYTSDSMIEDFYRVKYLRLQGNPLICHDKVVVLVCSSLDNNKLTSGKHSIIMNNGFLNDSKYKDITMNDSQISTIVDWQQYKCYDLLSNDYCKFSTEKDCKDYYEEEPTTNTPEKYTTQEHNQITNRTILPSPRNSYSWKFYIIGGLIVSAILAFAGGRIVYLYRWKIAFCWHRYTSQKKARLLRRKGNLLAKPEVYYDVFVSYSDVDRAWVLDHLVPNMEQDGEVSVCFHERDFQVGMTILENIIDCMDRSHALLLVVSSAFIYSKWCQFELHLAHYRLVETFRDQIVFVLLEDIPRKIRPQKLHSLMTTKTYLMWPQQPCKDEDYELFWWRLKRALRPNSSYGSLLSKTTESNLN